MKPLFFFKVMKVNNLVKLQLYIIISHVVGTPLHPYCPLPPPFPLATTDQFSLSSTYELLSLKLPSSFSEELISYFVFLVRPGSGHSRLTEQSQPSGDSLLSSDVLLRSKTPSSSGWND